MVRSVLALLLVSGLAFGQEAPRRAWQVPSDAPLLVAHPSWVFTEEGKARVDAKLLADAKRIAELEARDKAREAEVAAMAAQPVFTPKAVLLVGAGVAVVTAAITAVVVLRVKR